MAESTLIEPLPVTGAAIRSRRGEPTWELARLYPQQGEWTEEAFLRVVDLVDDRIELVDGCLEFLPMGSMLHAFLVDCLLTALKEHCRDTGAPYRPLTAPLPTRLWKGEYRDPDILLIHAESMTGSLRRQPTAADVAMVLELVSPSEEARQRDYGTKRQVYADARIPEYWIVDPDRIQITVLALDADSYRVVGEFGKGTIAKSVLLEGFGVDVTALFTAAGEIKTTEPPNDTTDHGPPASP